ncbi:MAG: tetratricopeptide repeat protein, partial [Planctomycetota bacterium]
MNGVDGASLILNDSERRRRESWYEAQGHYDEAEPLHQQSLEIRREQLGDRHPDVAQSLNNLAVLYREQG